MSTNNEVRRRSWHLIQIGFFSILSNFKEGDFYIQGHTIIRLTWQNEVRGIAISIMGIGPYAKWIKTTKDCLP